VTDFPVLDRRALRERVDRTAGAAALDAAWPAHALPLTESNSMPSDRRAMLSALCSEHLWLSPG
jgi:hypothetical protein